MQQIRVHEIVRRYHLAQSQKDYKERLDQLTEQLFREYLEVALESSGYRANEILCLRNINISITYEPDKSQIALIQNWVAQLEIVIKESLGQFAQGHWVRYPSLIEAVKSIARDVSVGKLNHLWAWQRMGLISLDCDTPVSTLRDWLVYIQQNPSVGVPVLYGIAQNGTLSRLIRSKILDINAVLHLANLKLHSQSKRLDWRLILEGITDDLVNESAAALGEYAKPVPAYSWSTSLLQDIATLIDVFELQNFRHWSEAKQLETLKIIYFLTGVQPEHLTITWGQNNRQISDFLLICLTDINKASSQSPVWHQAKNKLLNQEKHKAFTQMGYENADFVQTEAMLDLNEIEASEMRVTSQYGGLLFLVNILKSPEWQEKLHTVIEHDWNLDEVLQELCYLLIPKARKDPIVSIFSGRYFSSAQTRFHVSQFDSAGLEVIHALMIAIKQDVQQRLFTAGMVDTSDVIANMFDRSVHIEAETGWINVYFKMNDVDPHIRAAGLDIDPGFLPWLGYVVKFYYE